MNETPISVTLAARKFADCINRVRYQGASFLLEKNGIPVARIVPVRSTFSADFEQLATALRQARKGAPTDESEVVNERCAVEGPREISEPANPAKRPTLNW